MDALRDRGEFFALCDDDDLWHAEHLAELARHPRAALTFAMRKQERVGDEVIVLT